MSGWFGPNVTGGLAGTSGVVVRFAMVSSGRLAVNGEPIPASPRLPFGRHAIPHRGCYARPDEPVSEADDNVT
jgi:hypothetical protein